MKTFWFPDIWEEQRTVCADLKMSERGKGQRKNAVGLHNRGLQFPDCMSLTAKMTHQFGPKTGSNLSISTIRLINDGAV